MRYDFLDPVEEQLSTDMLSNASISVIASNPSISYLLSSSYENLLNKYYGEFSMVEIVLIESVDSLEIGFSLDEWSKTYRIGRLLTSSTEIYF